MKKELIKLANHLDRIGKIKEANYIDNLLSKSAEDTSNTDTDLVYRECLTGEPDKGTSCGQDPALKSFIVEKLNPMFPQDAGYSFSKCVEYSDKIKFTETNNPLDSIYISKYVFNDIKDPDQDIIASFFNLGAVDDGECHENVMIEGYGNCKLFFENNLKIMYVIKD